MFGLLQKLNFGQCLHQNHSRAFTRVQKVTEHSTVMVWRDGVPVEADHVRTYDKPTGKQYVVCLDCGKEFEYDWRTMKIVKPVEDSEPLIQTAAEPA